MKKRTNGVGVFMGVMVASVLSMGLALAGCGGASSGASTATGSGSFDNNSKDVTKIDVDKYVGQVGDYSHITVEVPAKQEITDSLVDEYINHTLMNLMAPEYVETDREVRTSDSVNINFQGIKDGVAFEGGTADNYDLVIGSNAFIPGFESGLIGYKKGDDVELNLQFPEEYRSEELAGQEVIFKVHINSVNEPVVPPLADNNIPELGIKGVNTVAEFKAYVFDSLERAAATTYENTLRDAVLKQIYDATEFKTDDVPETLLNYYIVQVEGTDQLAANRYSIPLKDYVEGALNMTFEEYEAQCKAQATEMVKDALLCEKIARIENIVVTDEDIKAQMVIDAKKYGYDSVDEFKAAMDEEDYKNYLVEVSVVDHILESATVNVTK